MRLIPVALLLLLLTGCLASPPPQPSLQTTGTVCSEPRPQVCTMEYAPVCASVAAGGRKSYSSGCNACADDSVSSFEQGPCPE